MVYPKHPRATREILTALKAKLAKNDVEVFAKDEIPEHLHWKQSKFAPPILVLAKPGTVILKASGQLQRPVSAKMQLYSYEALNGGMQQGISGYDPAETDMRGVFMARGPGKFHRYSPLVASSFAQSNISGKTFFQ